LTRFQAEGPGRSTSLDEPAEMSPAYFGMVMATGIVSIAAHLMGMAGVARLLFKLNVLVYGILWLLTLWRLVHDPRRLLGEMVDHLQGPGFFTTVAATSVLGSQFVTLAGDLHTAAILWGVSIVLWLGLSYAILAGIVVKERKPTLGQGINGGWLLAVVATQSVAVLGALLAARGTLNVGAEADFFALSMWLAGGMLYLWLMTLIFYRLAFFTLTPQEFLPPYWINMGAMAISTLAGALLISNAQHSPLLFSLLPFIKGLTLFFWAAGTWWIPMLVILTLWRHVYRRVPLKYDALSWAAVFPLGMYAAGTQQMSAALGIDFLGFLPPTFLYVALAAWVLAFVGLGFALVGRIRSFRR
jgi:tellurite resistance protein TehA-like permease